MTNIVVLADRRPAPEPSPEPSPPAPAYNPFGAFAFGLYWLSFWTGLAASWMSNPCFAELADPVKPAEKSMAIG